MIIWNIVGILLAAIVSATITAIIINSRSRHKAEEAEKEHIAQISELKESLNAKCMELEAEKRLAAEKIEFERKLASQMSESQAKALDEVRESHAKAIAALKENQEKQMEGVMANMKSETEKILRQREEELSKGNKSTMDDILKPLKESMDNMQKAMRENQETHIRNTAELSKQLEHAVKEMEQKTTDIGQKADSLSEALTGKPKVQGCFGENYLDTMLANEGLIEGIHYSREAANEDRSRPDFVFHFKDGMEQKDLIVDSKVSLTAYVNYVNATDEQIRKTALAEHIKSIRKHIDELAGKEYARKSANSFADYVLMFMPISAALQTAMAEEPLLWQEAYKKGVLITTEQTIMPFLKIIQITWKKYNHDTNLLEITKAAENMIDRVAAFYDSYKDLGNKLKAVYKAYDEGIGKLKDDGYSITTSARKVMSIGIRRSKGKEFSVPEEKLIRE
ncbi:MAG: DNA recombination protein RmuC [Candidatus Cryptobacteroides sp.]